MAEEEDHRNAERIHRQKVHGLKLITPLCVSGNLYTLCLILMATPLDQLREHKQILGLNTN